ncbi:hypothetical protein AgCh_016215 [Apium graveolens]
MLNKQKKVTIEARGSNGSDRTLSRQFQEPRSQDNAFRKANDIFHDSSGALKSTFLSMPTLENDNEADASMGIRNSRGKRPALGHKPAQFSLMPNITQPSAGLEFKLNINQLHDPVDFFSAYGQLQCDSTFLISFVHILLCRSKYCLHFHNRKSVRFMHHYSSAVSENDDTFLSSQEATRDDCLSLSKFVSQQETTHFDIDLQGKELSESISKTENRINELLDKLLSESNENLDRDGEPAQMQEGLQRKFPKNKNSQTDIPKLMSGKTPVKIKHVAENPVHTLASRTTPKSPFAALSLLNKHLSRSKTINDPFMAFDIVLSSARNVSSLEEFNQRSQHLDEGKELIISDKLTFSTKVEATRTAGTGTVSNHSVEGVTFNLLDKPVKVSLSTVSKNISSRGSNDVVMHHNGDNDMTDSATNGSNLMVENGRYILQEAFSYPPPCIKSGASSWGCTDVVALGHGLCHMDNSVEDMHQDATSFVQPTVNTDCSTTEDIKFSHSPSGQSDFTFTKGLLMNGQTITADSTFRKDLKQSNKALNRGSAKEMSNARKHEQKRRKAITRNSLLEIGTHWESGFRRSKRIRSRPLEYWKGERFLYGRVHESLATVIGKKYVSSGERGAYFQTPGMTFTESVYWNGCVHWLNVLEKKSVPKSAFPDCLCFNVDEEMLETFPRPPIGVRSTSRRSLYFGESEGHSYVIEVIHCPTCFKCMRRRVITPGVSVLGLISRDNFQEDSFFVLEIRGKAMRYNLVDKSFKVIWDFSVALNLKRIDYLAVWKVKSFTIDCMPVMFLVTTPLLVEVLQV